MRTLIFTILCACASEAFPIERVEEATMDNCWWESETTGACEYGTSFTVVDGVAHVSVRGVPWGTVSADGEVTR